MTRTVDADHHKRLCFEIQAGQNVSSNLALLHEDLAPLIGYLAKRHPIPQERRDLCKDALLIIWQTALKYNGTGSFSGWITNAITWKIYNACSSLRNKVGTEDERKRFREFVPVEDNVGFTDDVCSENLIDIDLLSQAIEMLPQRDRRFLKVFARSKHQKAAAAKLRISHQAVSQRLARIAARLKRLYRAIATKRL